MQQIKSILISWIETSCLCLSFNKVSCSFEPVDMVTVGVGSFNDRYFNTILILFQIYHHTLLTSLHNTINKWTLCHCCHNCYLNLRDGFTKGGCRGGAISYCIGEINWLIRQIDTWGGFLWTLLFRQSNNFLWQHPALENSLVVWVNVVDITTSQMSFIVNLKLNTQMIFLKLKIPVQRHILLHVWFSKLFPQFYHFYIGLQGLIFLFCQKICKRYILSHFCNIVQNLPCKSMENSLCEIAN